jgi:hypothetical protein
MRRAGQRDPGALLTLLMLWFGWCLMFGTMGIAGPLVAAVCYGV